jgi:hypothetical protein
MKQIMGKLLVAIILLLIGRGVAAAATAGCDGSGNCYIYASASGSGNGSSWTNAYTGFGSGSGKVNPASMARGVTYWIAAGSYGSVTFSTGDSGTSVITLEGATTASHGSATDWNSSFAGQALFGSGGIAITTDYWTINGQAVTGCSYPSNSTSCYSLKFQNPTNGGGQAVQLGNSSNLTNLTIEYAEVLGTNTQGSAYSDEGIDCTPQCSQTYIGYSWIHNVGSDNLSFNENGGDLLTLEYDWISYNHVGLNSTHSQCIQSTMGSMIIRYNVWQDCQSSGAITDAAGGNAPLTDWEIYGNIFFWDAAWNAEFTGNGAVGYDDGIVGLFSVANSGGTVKMYNNTIAGLNLASSQNCNGYAIYITQGSVVGTVENNLWYNFNSNCAAGAGNTGTYDYNAYYNVAGGKSDSGSHSTSSSTNPFANPTALTVAGFELTSDTTAGITLAAPYNGDMLGVTRAADGTWDRGALQIGSASSTLTPPASLTVTSVQ